MKTYIKLCSVATGIILLSACSGGSSNSSSSKPNDKQVTCSDTQFISADGKTCLTPSVSDITQEYINSGNDDKTLRFTITGKNLAALDVAIKECESGKVISKDDTTVVYECMPKQAGDTTLILSHNGKEIYSKDLTVKEKEVIKPSSTLTATGMTLCGDDLKNGLPCDGLTGEWKDLQQDGVVRAGKAMSYEQMLINGETCIKDEVTGLVWEKKTTSGLHSMYNTYSWYNTDAKVNGGDAGSENKGNCNGGASTVLCDTQHYIAELNKLKYCGYSDWRLPTINELQSISDYSRIPSISAVFDDINQGEKQYWWTSTPDTEEPDSYVWAVDFYTASTTSYNGKSKGLAVRAVRSEANQ